MSFLFFFWFRTLPAKVRLFFSLFISLGIAFFYKKLSGWGTNTSSARAMAPEKMHMATLAPNPVSLTLQRKRDNGLGFFFLFFFLIFFFLLNSSAGCTCHPRSSLNREGRGQASSPNLTKKRSL